MAKKKETYRWWNEDEVEDFITAFIVKCAERTFTPEYIGGLLALSVEGMYQANKEREI